MREHIDTIPVWDVYKTDCECPMCLLQESKEQRFLESFMGASVMEPDTRVEVNKKGFCQRHFKQMFDGGNRLGLALMTHTYLKETMAAMGDFSRAVNEGGARRSLFGKKTARSDAEGMRATESCILCERLRATMERYAYTLVYMWKTESAFRDALAKSKGMCLTHYFMAMEAADEHLSGKERETFRDALSKLEMENLSRLEKEIEWFTLKFDYRNQDKPWGNSQDSVERVINKLRGKCV